MRVVVDARSVVARKSGIGNYTEALLKHLVPRAEGMHFLILRHPDASTPIIEHERVEELTFPGATSPSSGGTSSWY